MAHKTFISYKYSEAQLLRDKIIDSLGDAATYYRGETSESPDVTDRKTEGIRTYLKQMIFDTSVMIVIISPNMTQSSWIDWEIEYALKEIKHGNVGSRCNGVLGVIMNDPDLSWFQSTVQEPDGHNVSYFNSNFTYDIINKNRFNQKPLQHDCATCMSVNELTGSYISFVGEDDFLSNPDKYIENAYEKSQNLPNYQITKYLGLRHLSTLYPEMFG